MDYQTTLPAPSAPPPEADVAARAPAEPTPAERTLAWMEREGYRFEFFQAVRLLAGARGGLASVGGPDVRRESVRVSPDPASVFPAADVRHVRRTPAGSVQVEVGFGGLYGVDAALPASFHDRVSTGSDDIQPLRDFLDLLGHRPYAQLWRAWSRFRPEVRPGRGAGATPPSDVHAARAAALAGASQTEPSPVPLPTLLPLAARLSSWSRSAEGLRAVLELATGERVRVRENIPRLVRLGDRPRLGRARLGVDAVVGARIHDESGKFRLEVGPLSLGAFRDLLPGAPGSARVDALVRLYAADALDYDVDLLLNSNEAPRLRLGDAASAQLGRNASVGTPPPPLVRRRVQYAPTA